MTDQTLYAIGDVHGHLDRLDLLLDLIEQDAKGEPHRLLFVGDYIDRGPQSKEVIDRLMGLPADTVFLKGNHEESMLDILDEPLDVELVYLWDYWGGHTTLASYGVDQLIDRERSQKLKDAIYKNKKAEGEDYAELRVNAGKMVEQFRAAVSQEHKEFLRGLKLTFETAKHFYCHAGVNFEQPLDRQLPDTLLCVRLPFLTSTAMAAKTIVHGHSITADHMPEVHPNRIAIDTGAYKSGNLTALALKGAESPRFIMTGPWA